MTAYVILQICRGYTVVAVIIYGAAACCYLKHTKKNSALELRPYRCENPPGYSHQRSVNLHCQEVIFFVCLETVVMQHFFSGF